jgi:HD superfamily phosphohydrolase
MKAAENYSLFPGANKPPAQFEHEDYSVAIIETIFADLIEQHPSNRRNAKITAAEVSALIAKRAPGGASLFWKDIISGQLDADRMDYLLRDSLHAGVSYGKYDLDRIVASVCAVRRPIEESEEPKIAIMKGGAYAAEALILARYWMHKQVYFHKTRLACNYHLEEAVRCVLLEGKAADEKLAFYPRPDSLLELAEFLKWDDYRIMGLLAQGHGGEHGKRLMERNHYRLVCELAESDSTAQELKDSSERNKSIIASLEPLVKHVTQPKTMWYKSKANDLILVEDDSKQQVGFLSDHSSLLKSINFGSLQFVYADRPDARAARDRYHTFLRLESEAKRAGTLQEAQLREPGLEIERPPETGQLSLGTTRPVQSVQIEGQPQKGKQNAS